MTALMAQAFTVSPTHATPLVSPTGVAFDKGINRIPSYEGVNGVDLKGPVSTLEIITPDSTERVIFDKNGRVTKEQSKTINSTDYWSYTYTKDSPWPSKVRFDSTWATGMTSGWDTEIKRDKHGRLLLTITDDLRVERSWRDLPNGGAETVRDGTAVGFGIETFLYNPSGRLVRETRTGIRPLMCFDGAGAPRRCTDRDIGNEVTEVIYRQNEANPSMIGQVIRRTNGVDREEESFYADGYLYRQYTQKPGSPNWYVKQYVNYAFDERGNWVARDKCELWADDALHNCETQSRKLTYYN